MQSLSCSIEGVSLKRLQGSKSAKRLSQLFEIARVLVRLDHVASGIISANHIEASMVGTSRYESKSDMFPQSVETT
jgi:hypothetical protein